MIRTVVSKDELLLTLFHSVTVTVSSTVLTTATLTVTNVATVVNAVVVTSTVNSVVDVTVTSQGATETDWTYVTATAAVAKRSVGAPEGPCRPRDRTPGGFFAALLRVFDVTTLPEDVPRPVPIASPAAAHATLHARQATRAGSATAVTTTVTTVVTQASDITSVFSTTITTATTSTVLVTVFQTNTKSVPPSLFFLTSPRAQKTNNPYPECSAPRQQCRPPPR